MKPRTAAIDLADHDIVDDDCDLVVGPLAGRHSTSNVSTGLGNARPLAGSSFKDTSILGTVAVTSKLAQANSVPMPATIGRPSFKCSTGSNSVYCDGNPIIATASPSRPASAALRQPRSSAPSGTSVPPPATPPAQSKTAHGSLTGASRACVDQIDSAMSRMQGDIMGGDSDDDDKPSGKGQPVLRRRDSNRSLAPSSKASAKALQPTDGVDTSPAGAPAKSASERLMKPAEGSTSSSRRVSYEGCGRGAALPCVDVEPERRQRLHRLDSAEGQEKGAVVVSVQSKSAACTEAQAGAAAGRKLSERRISAEGAGHLPLPTQPSGAAVTERPMSKEARPTSGRFLARLLSGSLLTPGAAAQAQKERCAAKDSDDNTGGIRNLFSRPSSAKHRSEGGASQQQQQQPAQKLQMQAPQLPSSPQPPLPQPQQHQPKLQPKQAFMQQQQPQQQPQRYSHHAHPDAVIAFAEAQDEVPRSAIGGGRQPSGLLKRTASAIAAALGR